LHTLADIRRAQGRYDEAAALGREALALRQRSLSDQNALVGMMWRFLAQVALEAGRLTEADSLSEHAVAVLRVALPQGHPRVLEAESTLAAVRAAERKAGRRESGEAGR